MRKIFLDVGANVGQSIRRFQKLFEDANDYEIFSFEPHKESTKGFDQLGPNITVINKAAWIYNGTVNFFPAGVSPAGSTLLKDKTTWKVSKTPIKIPCVDFNKWMMKNFKPEDYIILKMNIEGAEYEVLEALLQSRTLSWVNKLYVSFHFRKIPSIGPKRHKKLVEAIRAKGHTILKW